MVKVLIVLGKSCGQGGVTISDVYLVLMITIIYIYVMAHL